ncbi:hypothetical protein DFQ28_003129 [Apophysomyces sp. BC1034]|nr:hypothetical protein DFQ28_003129 [Apophysomyces sp. BC1034]
MEFQIDDMPDEESGIIHANLYTESGGFVEVIREWKGDSVPESCSFFWEIPWNITSGRYFVEIDEIASSQGPEACDSHDDEDDDDDDDDEDDDDDDDDDDKDDEDNDKIMSHVFVIQTSSESSHISDGQAGPVSPTDSLNHPKSKASSSTKPGSDSKPAAVSPTIILPIIGSTGSSDYSASAASLKTAETSSSDKKAAKPSSSKKKKAAQASSPEKKKIARASSSEKKKTAEPSSTKAKSPGAIRVQEKRAFLRRF